MNARPLEFFVMGKCFLARSAIDMKVAVGILGSVRPCYSTCFTNASVSLVISFPPIQAIFHHSSALRARNGHT